MYLQKIIIVLAKNKKVLANEKSTCFSLIELSVFFLSKNTPQTLENGAARELFVINA